MSTYTTNLFRDAVKSPAPSVEVSESVIQSEKYYSMISKVFYTTWGLSLLTSIILFIFLYQLNPPIVQNSKKDKDLSKPGPNFWTISIISILAGSGVFCCSKWM